MGVLQRNGLYCTTISFSRTHGIERHFLMAGFRQPLGFSGNIFSYLII
jgi:hypothetical protein